MGFEGRPGRLEGRFRRRIEALLQGLARFPPGGAEAVPGAAQGFDVLRPLLPRSFPSLGVLVFDGGGGQGFELGDKPFPSHQARLKKLISEGLVPGLEGIEVDAALVHRG